MELLLDHFPVFEANQVLTSGHLNNVFDYLDQEGRQTRSHLIGIGIACGLEISLDAGGTSTLLTKGCGVTSEGYLIVEPEDVTLTSYRTYVAPPDVAYSPFTDSVLKPRYPLWELFPAGEPNTTPLNGPAGFLSDKAVLLFLELKKQGLRNCSPNSCDDKGSVVIATLRRLLIRRTDLDQIIAAASALGDGLSTADVDAALSTRLNLPDLRLPRFDTPNTQPVTANDVYAAFLKIFHAQGLVHRLADALSAAYAAFRPVLLRTWANDPFAGFAGAFGFLDGTPADTTQVKFLQYYVDLFDDLVAAYDEFRWKGAELICSCCPPSDLFPRHLMLGLLHPEAVASPGIYRQRFLPSPTVGRCREQTVELVQLFARLAGMAASFTNTPALPNGKATTTTDPQIRISPSVLGERALAAKAIPYYYVQTGAPPLYRLWSPERTRRNRAHQNLGYRSDESVPTAPDFVTSPLDYDLEPFDFLRVEGHLGKDYRHVLKVLLTQRSQRRLPIDVIALRAGVYDDSQPVDLSEEAARFQDLEADYETLRADMLRSFAEGAMELYDAQVANFQAAGGTPKLALLTAHAPNYRYQANSVGAWFEQYLSLFGSRPYIDVDQNKIDPGAVLQVYCALFSGTSGLANENFAHAVALYYMMKLAEILPAKLDDLTFADLENKYQDLVGLVRYLRTEAAGQVPADLKSFLPKEELIDLFDEILFDSKLDGLRSIHDDQLRRIKELRKRQFLSSFLSQHPGIQHKAGVPIGGTFILVYSAAPPRAAPELKVAEIARELAPEVALEAAPAAGTKVRTASPMLLDAIQRVSSNKVLSDLPDIGVILGSLLGRLPIFAGPTEAGGLDQPSVEAIAKAVAELADGEVIADFYLPYRVCCDCPGIQYVLAPPPPNFTADVACTDEDGKAKVVVEAKGGTAPYELSVDQGPYRELTTATVLLGPGAHSLRVRDAEAVESTIHTVQVPPPLGIGEAGFKCLDGKYVATATISGGTPPYSAAGRLLPGADVSTVPTASGNEVSIEVTDSRKCKAVRAFTHTCPPPPALTVEMGCTGDSGTAKVAVEVAGGTAPFAVSVDGGDFQPSTGSVLLGVGAHSLKVRDADGSESPVQQVDVPPFLVVGDPSFTCANGQFTAKVTIAGGTLPYSVNGAPMDGTEFTTPPIASGTEVTLDVSDSRGCTAQRSFTHVCLPCDGIALRRGYRFWMPDPDPDNPYQRFEFAPPIFRVEAQSGQVIDLSAKLAPILTADPHTLDTNTFPATVKAWIDGINALIRSVPELNGGEVRWVTLEYRPRAPGQLGELWIEYFGCLKFEIGIRSTFLRSDDRTVQLIVSYTPDKTLIKDGAVGATSPAFDGQRIDKNVPAPAPEPICPAAPAFTLRVTSSPGMNPTFKVSVIPATKNLTFLWEAPDALPWAGNGSSMTTQYRTQGAKQVTISAFTKDGCSARQTVPVQIVG